MVSILFFAPIVFALFVTLRYRILWYKTLGRKGLSFLDSTFVNAIIFCTVPFIMLFTASGEIMLLIVFLEFLPSFVLISLIGSIAVMIVKRKITDGQWVIYAEESKRRNVKKRRFVLLLASSFLLVGYGYTYSKIYGTENYAFQANWGIDIPKAAKTINVYSDVGGFPADGFTYTILEYKEKDWEKVKQLAIWSKMDKATYDQFCKDFAWTLSGMYNEGDKKSYEQYLKFKEYPLGFSPSTLYFYKTKNDGYDYIFSFLNDKERKIYILENK